MVRHREKARHSAFFLQKAVKVASWRKRVAPLQEAITQDDAHP